MSVIKLDKIDEKIIRMLQVDARTSFKKIADQCNRSADIIKNRYNKMKKNGIIRRSTIVIDPKKMGLGNLVMMGIKINQYHTDSILNTIKKITGILVVTRSIGQYDLEAIFLLKNIEKIGTTKEIIADLPEVINVDVNIFVDKPLLCPKNFEFE